jgi:hypothetical protein
MLHGRAVALASAAVVALAAASGCGDDEPAAAGGPSCTPSPEVCNGKDDDCDGAADEQLGTVSCGTGGCAVTVSGCDGGTPVECVPLAPGVETCDGKDDDCDGTVDDGCECTSGAERPCYGGPGGTAGVGACRAGVQRCDGGRWSAVCAEEVLPAEESCNGKDDDCDGRIGEAAAAGTCDTGLPGACATGVLACTAEGQVCVAPAPSADVCNGRDDDCNPATLDGSAERWFGERCDGTDGDLCKEGTMTCVDGAAACNDPNFTNQEVCNAFDDDCDGQVDEGFVLDGNPACADARRLGSVRGDIASDLLLPFDWQEAWLHAEVTDDPAADRGLVGVRIGLNTSVTRSMVLEVYCPTCGGEVKRTLSVGTGQNGALVIAKEDVAGVDDSFAVLLRVSESGGSTGCGFWSVSIQGNQGVGATGWTCP